MYKQLILVRRDLNMSPGKLAAQVAHASMAFILSMIKNNSRHVMMNQYPAVNLSTGEPMLYRRGDLYKWAREAYDRGEQYFYVEPVDLENPYGSLRLCDPKEVYHCDMIVDAGLYDNWINESVTKIVCGTRDKLRLERAMEWAKELGMKEGEDFFPIYDACRTELTPEEESPTGGRTLTCVGFKPMEAEKIDIIGKEFHLL